MSFRKINYEQGIIWLQILDLSGHEIYSTIVFGTVHQWQGITEEGIIVPKGFYIIRALGAVGNVIGLQKLIRR